MRVLTGAVWALVDCRDPLLGAGAGGRGGGVGRVSSGSSRYVKYKYGKGEFPVGATCHPDRRYARCATKEPRFGGLATSGAGLSCFNAVALVEAQDKANKAYPPIPAKLAGMGGSVGPDGLVVDPRPVVHQQRGRKPASPGGQLCLRHQEIARNDSAGTVSMLTVRI